MSEPVTSRAETTIRPVSIRNRWQQLDGSARRRIESIDETRREWARSLFFGYRDKEFSFTDCCSFVLMRELRIRRALTLDHHFLQMGFEVIP